MCQPVPGGLCELQRHHGTTGGGGVDVVYGGLQEGGVEGGAAVRGAGAVIVARTARPV